MLHCTELGEATKTNKSLSVLVKQLCTKHTLYYLDKYLQTLELNLTIFTNIGLKFDNIYKHWTGI